jgi:hypothetical protein
MTTTSKSVFLLALLAGLLFHVSSFAGDTNAPALFCPTPSFDFGRVANRTNVTHVFELVNCGTNRLAIAGAAGSCDACIYGVLKDKVLASGQTTTVAVTCGSIGVRSHFITIAGFPFENRMFCIFFFCTNEFPTTGF